MGNGKLSEWLLGACEKCTLFIIISELLADANKVHSDFISKD
jgi:hypothetical protein